MQENGAVLRDALILAGLEEINDHGVGGFSIRRVAERCGVSCAAPYRHFAGKKDFIDAIVDYVNGQWAIRQEAVVAACGDSPREQIIEVSLHYIRFLMEKPLYRSVLMLKDEEYDNLYHKKRTEFGSMAQTLIACLKQADGLEEDVWNRKLLTFRALIFGAVFLFDTGEFEFNEKAMEHLRYVMQREFDVL